MSSDCKRILITGTLIPEDHPTCELLAFKGSHVFRHRHIRYWVCEDEQIVVIPLRATETGGTEIRIPLSQLRKVIG
jgi:hypothetical protein